MHLILLDPVDPAKNRMARISRIKNRIKGHFSKIGRI
jgi:hypothetical protein